MSEIISDAEHIVNMTNSDGWRLVKPKLDALILDLQNMGNLDRTKPETLLVQVDARLMAAQLIYDWLKREVYGAAEQAALIKAPQLPQDHILREE